MPTTTTKTLWDTVNEYLAELNDDETIYLWNYFCESYNRYEDMIQDMCEFDDRCNGLTPTEIANLTREEDFNPNDDYFYETVYGFASTSDIFDIVDLSDLTDYIIDNDDDMGDPDIEEILHPESED